MQITRFLARATAAFAAIALAIVLTSASCLAASGFVGKWKVEDTKGEPFTIWLSDDGTAKGDRSGEGLAGMWKEEGNAAVISWDSGWTTTISKEGDSYKKTASEKGKPAGPATAAEKVE
ncbi:MAG: hypothetical protein WED13_09160 [Methyloceanibacter sp.]